MRAKEDSFALPKPDSWPHYWGDYWKNESGEIYGILLFASPDTDAYLDYSGAGAMLFATSQYDLFGPATAWADRVKEHYAKECNYIAGSTIESDLWKGVYDTFSGCNSQNTTMFLVTMDSKTQPGEAVVQLKFVSSGEADIEVLAEMLAGMEILGKIP